MAATDLLIAAPLRLEAMLIASGRPPGRVHRTGMGPRRARAAVPALLADPAEALLVMGFGGGLADEGEAGDVIVADAVQGPDGERIECAGAELLAAALAASGLAVNRGTVASVPRIAMGEARMRLRATGAIAADMESAWLAPAARGRPFTVVRVLSDTPARKLTRPLSTVAGIARASATLRRAARVLHEWAPGELHGRAQGE
jgi:4-hydroxy-3-methylbut-2-enyl diphosphate reductase